MKWPGLSRASKAKMDSNHLVIGHDHIGNCRIMSMNYYRSLEHRLNTGLCGLCMKGGDRHASKQLFTYYQTANWPFSESHTQASFWTSQSCLNLLLNLYKTANNRSVNRFNLFWLACWKLDRRDLTTAAGPCRSLIVIRPFWRLDNRFPCPRALMIDL